MSIEEDKAMADRFIEPRFCINIYCGGTYCGNGYFETEAEAIAWAEADPFCDKARIADMETGKKRTIKMEKE